MTSPPFFTVKQLAARWGVAPATVRWRLLYLRTQGAGPTAEQIERGPGRWTAYRADYVAVLERHFPPRGCPPVLA